MMSFKDDIYSDYRNMIDLKVALGYKEKTYAYYIEKFIEFCLNKYPDADGITEEMINSWLEIKLSNSTGTRRNVISILRVFSRYLNAIGKKAFIPDDKYQLHVERYIPYRFNDDELIKLFDAFDNFTSSNQSPKREYIIPVLFRMMLCCGMRPGEPLHLRKSDVDLKNGDIYIHQSKHNKDRHILMSENLLELCQEYDFYMGRREWFFQKWDGNPLSSYWSYEQFNIGWSNSGLEKRGNPRQYDLRHHFASSVLMQWIEEGRDVMAMFPYLSTYMGHQCFRHTLYYIHLLPERLRKAANIDWEKLNSIYKKEVLK